MKVTPSAVEGVNIYGPDAPEFESALVKILGRAPKELLVPALPFSVIVENASARAICLLGVRFDMTGPKARQYSVLHYADTLRNPEKGELRPGTKRFVCAEPAYTSLVIRGEVVADTRGRMNLDNLRRMLHIRASLDCIAFDDGTFYGPDSQGGLERFARESAAEAALLAEVLDLQSASIATIEAVLYEAVQDPLNRGRRGVARKLIEGLEAGGRDELIHRARSWRCRMPLTRSAVVAG
ncbi:MAG: hypothetical protein QOJ99_2023 [Bryobacterales bacterium]|jgi:hypothetical protein|nr:hypothetical protein [Bryobacterales bacterium]